MSFRTDLENHTFYHTDYFRSLVWKEIENKFPFLERIQDAIWPLFMNGTVINYKIKENILSLKFVKNFSGFSLKNHTSYDFSNEIILDFSNKKIFYLKGVKLTFLYKIHKCEFSTLIK